MDSAQFMHPNGANRLLVLKEEECYMRQLFFAMILFVLTGCGISGSLSRYPAEDQQVYELLKQARKKSADASIRQQLESQYNTAVASHLQDIQQYNNGTASGWESIIKEYEQLNRLAEAVQENGIPVKRYDAEYGRAKKDAAQYFYNDAVSLLNENNRQSAQEAYTLLQKVQRFSPGYKDVNRLIDQAYNKSILTVVINPVDYYSRSYSSWGFNDDYIQQQLLRDMKYQLSSSNVRVLTNWEARTNKIYPDRVVDIKWDEMFIPTPMDQTYSRQVSRQIQVGQTEDKKPVYNTVYATVYVTRRTVQSHGSISCRVVEPATNNILLYDNFPASYNWYEEYGTYQGDSRALSASDWALINNRSSFRNPSQGDFLNNVFRQAYPQLISRIRSVTW
jgi:hypothetical protein